MTTYNKQATIVWDKDNSLSSLTDEEFPASLTQKMQEFRNAKKVLVDLDGTAVTRDEDLDTVSFTYKFDSQATAEEWIALNVALAAEHNKTIISTEIVTI